MVELSSLYRRLQIPVVGQNSIYRQLISLDRVSTFVTACKQKLSEKIDIEFGHAVADLRKKLGLTQDELAFRSEIHRAYIGTIERGEKSPTLDTINKLANGLGVTVFDILF